MSIVLVQFWCQTVNIGTFGSNYAHVHMCNSQTHKCNMIQESQAVQSTAQSMLNGYMSTSVTTQILIRSGQNPIFNETLITESLNTCSKVCPESSHADTQRVTEQLAQCGCCYTLLGMAKWCNSPFKNKYSVGNRFIASFTVDIFDTNRKCLVVFAQCFPLSSLSLHPNLATSNIRHLVTALKCPAGYQFNKWPHLPLPISS
jgi:hypothetical protein